MALNNGSMVSNSWALVKNNRKNILDRFLNILSLNANTHITKLVTNDDQTWIGREILRLVDATVEHIGDLSQASHITREIGADFKDKNVPVAFVQKAVPLIKDAIKEEWAEVKKELDKVSNANNSKLAWDEAESSKAGFCCFGTRKSEPTPAPTSTKSTNGKGNKSARIGVATNNVDWNTACDDAWKNTINCMIEALLFFMEPTNTGGGVSSSADTHDVDDRVSTTSSMLPQGADEDDEDATFLIPKRGHVRAGSSVVIEEELNRDSLEFPPDEASASPITDTKGKPEEQGGSSNGSTSKDPGAVEDAQPLSQSSTIEMKSLASDKKDNTNPEDTGSTPTTTQDSETTTTPPPGTDPTTDVTPESPNTQEIHIIPETESNTTPDTTPPMNTATNAQTNPSTTTTNTTTTTTGSVGPDGAFTPIQLNLTLEDAQLAIDNSGMEAVTSDDDDDDEEQEQEQEQKGNLSGKHSTTSANTNANSDTIDGFDISTKSLNNNTTTTTTDNNNTHTNSTTDLDQTNDELTKEMLLQAQQRNDNEHILRSPHCASILARTWHIATSSKYRTAFTTAFIYACSHRNVKQSKLKSIVEEYVHMSKEELLQRELPATTTNSTKRFLASIHSSIHILYECVVNSRCPEQYIPRNHFNANTNSKNHKVVPSVVEKTVACGDPLIASALLAVPKVLNDVVDTNMKEYITSVDKIYQFTPNAVTETDDSLLREVAYKTSEPSLSPAPFFAYAKESAHASILPKSIINIYHGLGSYLAEIENLYDVLADEIDLYASVDNYDPLKLPAEILCVALTKALKAVMSVVCESKLTKENDKLICSWQEYCSDAWKVYMSSVFTLICEGVYIVMQTKRMVAQFMVVKRSWNTVTGCAVGFENEPGMNPDIDSHYDIESSDNESEGKSSIISLLNAHSLSMDTHNDTSHMSTITAVTDKLTEFSRSWAGNLRKDCHDSIAFFRKITDGTIRSHWNFVASNAQLQKTVIWLTQLLASLIANIDGLCEQNRLANDAYVTREAVILLQHHLRVHNGNAAVWRNIMKSLSKALSTSLGLTYTAHVRLAWSSFEQALECLLDLPPPLTKEELEMIKADNNWDQSDQLIITDEEILPTEFLKIAGHEWDIDPYRILTKVSETENVRTFVLDTTPPSLWVNNSDEIMAAAQQNIRNANNMQDMIPNTLSLPTSSTNVPHFVQKSQAVVEDMIYRNVTVLDFSLITDDIIVPTSVQNLWPKEKIYETKQSLSYRLNLLQVSVTHSIKWSGIHTIDIGILLLGRLSLICPELQRLSHDMTTSIRTEKLLQEISSNTAANGTTTTVNTATRSSRSSSSGILHFDESYSRDRDSSSIKLKQDKLVDNLNLTDSTTTTTTTNSTTPNPTSGNDTPFVLPPPVTEYTYDTILSMLPTGVSPDTYQATLKAFQVIGLCVLSPATQWHVLYCAIEEWAFRQYRDRPNSPYYTQPLPRNAREHLESFPSADMFLGNERHVPKGTYWNVDHVQHVRGLPVTQSWERPPDTLDLAVPASFFNRNSACSSAFIWTMKFLHIPQEVHLQQIRNIQQNQEDSSTSTSTSTSTSDTILSLNSIHCRNDMIWTRDVEHSWKWLLCWIADVVSEGRRRALHHLARGGTNTSNDLIRQKEEEESRQAMEILEEQKRQEEAEQKRAAEEQRQKERRAKKKLRESRRDTSPERDTRESRKQSKKRDKKSKKDKYNLDVRTDSPVLHIKTAPSPMVPNGVVGGGYNTQHYGNSNEIPMYNGNNTTNNGDGTMMMHPPQSSEHDELNEDMDMQTDSYNLTTSSSSTVPPSLHILPPHPLHRFMNNNGVKFKPQPPLSPCDSPISNPTSPMYNNSAAKSMKGDSENRNTTTLIRRSSYCTPKNTSETPFYTTPLVGWSPCGRVQIQTLGPPVLANICHLPSLPAYPATYDAYLPRIDDLDEATILPPRIKIPDSVSDLHIHDEMKRSPLADSITKAWINIGDNLEHMKNLRELGISEDMNITRKAHLGGIPLLFFHPGQVAITAGEELLKTVTICKGINVSFLLHCGTPILVHAQAQGLIGVYPDAFPLLRASADHPYSLVRYSKSLAGDILNEKFGTLRGAHGNSSTYLHPHHTNSSLHNPRTHGSLLALPNSIALNVTATPHMDMDDTYPLYPLSTPVALPPPVWRPHSHMFYGVRARELQTNLDIFHSMPKILDLPKFFGGIGLRLHRNGSILTEDATIQEEALIEFDIEVKVKSVSFSTLQELHDGNVSLDLTTIPWPSHMVNSYTLNSNVDGIDAEPVYTQVMDTDDDDEDEMNTIITGDTLSPNNPHNNLQIRKLRRQRSMKPADIRNAGELYKSQIAWLRSRRNRVKALVQRQVDLSRGQIIGTYCDYVQGDYMLQHSLTTTTTSSSSDSSNTINTISWYNAKLSYPIDPKPNTTLLPNTTQIDTTPLLSVHHPSDLPSLRALWDTISIETKPLSNPNSGSINAKKSTSTVLTAPHPLPKALMELSPEQLKESAMIAGCPYFQKYAQQESTVEFEEDTVLSLDLVYKEFARVVSEKLPHLIVTLNVYAGQLSTFHGVMAQIGSKLDTNQSKEIAHAIESSNLFRNEPSNSTSSTTNTTLTQDVNSMHTSTGNGAANPNNNNNAQYANLPCSKILQGIVDIYHQMSIACAHPIKEQIFASHYLSKINTNDTRLDRFLRLCRSLVFAGVNSSVLASLFKCLVEAIMMIANQVNPKKYSISHLYNKQKQKYSSMYQYLNDPDNILDLDNITVACTRQQQIHILDKKVRSILGDGVCSGLLWVHSYLKCVLSHIELYMPLKSTQLVNATHNLIALKRTSVTLSAAWSISPNLISRLILCPPTVPDQDTLMTIMLSWKHVRKVLLHNTDLLFRGFFYLYPQTRLLMQNVDQLQHTAAMVVLLAQTFDLPITIHEVYNNNSNSLNSSEQCTTDQSIDVWRMKIQEIEKCGARHSTHYGVQPEYYGAYAFSVLTLLQLVLGDIWVSKAVNTDAMNAGMNSGMDTHPNTGVHGPVGATAHHHTNLSTTGASTTSSSSSNMRVCDAWQNVMVFMCSCLRNGSIVGIRHPSYTLPGQSPLSFVDLEAPSDIGPSKTAIGQGYGHPAAKCPFIVRKPTLVEISEQDQSEKALDHAIQIATSARHGDDALHHDLLLGAQVPVADIAVDLDTFANTTVPLGFDPISLATHSFLEGINDDQIDFLEKIKTGESYNMNIETAIRQLALYTVPSECPIQYPGRDTTHISANVLKSTDISIPPTLFNTMSSDISASSSSMHHSQSHHPSSMSNRHSSLHSSTNSTNPNHTQTQQLTQSQQTSREDSLSGWSHPLRPHFLTQISRDLLSVVKYDKPTESDEEDEDDDKSNHTANMSGGHRFDLRHSATWSVMSSALLNNVVKKIPGVITNLRPKSTNKAKTNVNATNTAKVDEDNGGTEETLQHVIHQMILKRMFHVDPRTIALFSGRNLDSHTEVVVNTIEFVVEQLRNITDQSQLIDPQGTNAGNASSSNLLSPASPANDVNAVMSPTTTTNLMQQIMLEWERIVPTVLGPMDRLYTQDTVFSLQNRIALQEHLSKLGVSHLRYALRQSFFQSFEAAMLGSVKQLYTIRARIERRRVRKALKNEEAESTDKKAEQNSYIYSGTYSNRYRRRPPISSLRHTELNPLSVEHLEDLPPSASAKKLSLFRDAYVDRLLKEACRLPSQPTNVEGDPSNLDRAFNRRMDLVKDVWARVSRMAKATGKTFFSNIMRMSEEMRNLFKNSEGVQRAFMTTIGHTIENLQSSPIEVITNLRALGSRHILYNTNPEAFEMHAVVFVQTVRKAFANDWNDQLERSLKWMMDFIIVCMLEGMVEEEHKKSTELARATVVSQIERAWVDMQPLLHKHARKALSQSEMACVSVRFAYEQALHDYKQAYNVNGGEQETLLLQHLVKESHEAVARLWSFIARSAKQIASPLVRPGTAVHAAEFSDLIWTSTTKADCENLPVDAVQLALITLYRNTMSRFNFTLMDLYQLADTLLDTVHEALIPNISSNPEQNLVNPNTTLNEKERILGVSSWVWLVQRCVNIIATHIASEDEATQLDNASSLVRLSLTRAYPATQPAPALTYTRIPTLLSSQPKLLSKFAQESVNMLPSLAALMQSHYLVYTHNQQQQQQQQLQQLQQQNQIPLTAQELYSPLLKSKLDASTHIYPRGSLVQLLFTYMLSSAFPELYITIPPPPPKEGEKPGKPIDMNSDSFVPSARTQAGITKRKVAMLYLIGRTHVHTQLEILWEAVATQAEMPGKESKGKITLLAQRLAGYTMNSELFAMEPTHKAPNALFRTEAFSGTFAAFRCNVTSKKTDKDVSERKEREKERERKEKLAAMAKTNQSVGSNNVNATTATSDRDSLGVWLLNCMCVSLRQILGPLWGRKECDALYWLCSHYVFPWLRAGMSTVDREWLFAQQAWSWLTRYVVYHMTSFTRVQSNLGQRLSLFLDHYASNSSPSLSLAQHYNLCRQVASIHGSKHASALFFSPLRNTPLKVTGPLEYSSALCTECTVQGNYILAKFEIPRSCVSIHNQANLKYIRNMVEKSPLLKYREFSMEWFQSYMTSEKLDLALPSVTLPSTLKLGIPYLQNNNKHELINATSGLLMTNFLKSGSEVLTNRVVSSYLVFPHQNPTKKRTNVSIADNDTNPDRRAASTPAQISFLVAVPKHIWDSTIYSYINPLEITRSKVVPLSVGCMVGVSHELLAQSSIPDVQPSLSSAALATRSTPQLFLRQLPPLMPLPRSIVSITMGTGCFPLLSLISAITLARERQTRDSNIPADLLAIKAQSIDEEQTNKTFVSMSTTSIACLHTDYYLPLPFGVALASHLSRGIQPNNLHSYGMQSENIMQALENEKTAYEGLKYPPPGTVSARLMVMCGIDGNVLRNNVGAPTTDCDPAVELCSPAVDACHLICPTFVPPKISPADERQHKEYLQKWTHLRGIPDAKLIGMGLPMLCGPMVQPPHNAVKAAKYFSHCDIDCLVNQTEFRNQENENLTQWKHQVVFVGGPEVFVRYILIGLYILGVPRSRVAVYIAKE